MISASWLSNKIFLEEGTGVDGMEFCYAKQPFLHHTEYQFLV